MNYFLSNKFSKFSLKPQRASWYPVFFTVVAGIFVATTAIFAEEPIKPSVQQGLFPQKVAIKKDPENWRRDPFLLLNDKVSVQNTPGFSPGGYSAFKEMGAVSLETVRLQGIMRVESTSYALVNGRVLKAGERIAEGIIIKEIGKYHIVVRKNGSLQTYNIFQGKLK